MFYFPTAQVENFASFSLPKVSPDTHFVSQNAIRSVAQPLKPHNIPLNSVKYEIYIIPTSFWAFTISLLHQNQGILHHFYIIEKSPCKKPTPFLHHYFWFLHRSHTKIFRIYTISTSFRHIMYYTYIVFSIFISFLYRKKFP